MCTCDIDEPWFSEFQPWRDSVEVFQVCACPMALTWGANSLPLSRNCPINSTPKSGSTVAHLTYNLQQQRPVFQWARPLVQFSEYLTTPRPSVISQDCARPGMIQHSIHPDSWVTYFTSISPSYGSIASLKIQLQIRTWLKLHGLFLEHDVGVVGLTVGGF
jgi:hypothetical protein